MTKEQLEKRQAIDMKMLKNFRQQYHELLAKFEGINVYTNVFGELMAEFQRGNGQHNSILLHDCK